MKVDPGPARKTAAAAISSGLAMRPSGLFDSVASTSGDVDSGPSIGVSVGQSVSQGQVIGYSGCTGHCFGPHVHFETRINGAPVNPMGYL